MTQNKLPLKEILAAIDMNAKLVWDELSDEEKKQVNFWLLNRYVSNIDQKDPDVQAMAIIKTNEYYNKNYNQIQKNHKQLLWQLLCASSVTGQVERHPWLALKSKKSSSKPTRLLEKIYPNMKSDEVELLARISSKQELKQLAEEHGIDNPDL